jgi:hypothetical protein
MTPLMKHIEDSETWIHWNTVQVGICEIELLRQHPSVNSMFVWALFRTGLAWGRTDWLPICLRLCVYLGWRGAVLVWGSEGSAVEPLYEYLNILQPPSWEVP